MYMLLLGERDKKVGDRASCICRRSDRIDLEPGLKPVHRRIM